MSGRKWPSWLTRLTSIVWVIDDREAYCNAERFPFAERRLIGPLDESLEKLDVDENTFCIIVTRGHHHDEQALYHLAARSARFIGMIGSRRKIRLIFDDLLREGISADACGGCMRRWAWTSARKPSRKLR